MFWAMYTRRGKCSARVQGNRAHLRHVRRHVQGDRGVSSERLDLLLDVEIRPVHEHRRTADHLDVLIAEAERLQVVASLLTAHPDRG